MGKNKQCLGNLLLFKVIAEVVQWTQFLTHQFYEQSLVLTGHTYHYVHEVEESPTLIRSNAVHYRQIRRTQTKVSFCRCGQKMWREKNPVV